MPLAKGEHLESRRNWKFNGKNASNLVSIGISAQQTDRKEAHGNKEPSFASR